MDKGKKKEVLNLEEIVKEIEEEILKEHCGEITDEFRDGIRKRVREMVLQGVSSEIQSIIEEIKRKRVSEIEEDRRKEHIQEEEFLRFNLHFRIQHMILFTSVIILILTGLPLRYPDFEPLSGLIWLLGGIEYSRVLHRIGAAGLILVAIYHTLYTILHPDGRRDFLLLIPTPKDFRDFYIQINYFLGRSKERPKFGRFSYIEKFDYWAVYWGCVIMIGSGLPLWFEDISLRFLPKFILDISKEAHSDEALLATLAIVIWHFYNVHFNPDKFPMSWTWWTGRISKHEMMKEHPLEYEEIMAKRGKKGD